ncbi:LysR family transcriptional regulator [Rhodoferax sp.]|uniref:LysR family transcriptional regulator n=1 Tax=Rhodoferax sp. TaxID=50421 RepID=UPI00374DF8E8
MDQLQLSTIALFCKAAELKSFTAAARALGLTPAAVSRGVARLEDRLGVKLLRRTTRSMQLTDDGQLYFAQCRAALAQIDDVEKTITGQQAQVRGLLRISAPSTYAHYRLLPRLPEFHARFPELELEVHISNRSIDFVDEGFDVAIRQGNPPDSRLVARKLEDAPIGIYASPAYLQTHGTPQNLDELQDPARHSMLAFVMPNTGRVLPWMFEQDGQPLEIVPRGRVQISEDPMGMVTLARAGMGLVQTAAWIADSHPGELVQVLQPYAGRSRPFHLLYPQNRHLAARVRALVDFLCG